MPNSGVYMIKCLANDRIYIGSATHLRIRKFAHYKALSKNMHYNQHLQRAFNKYGLRNFEFHVVEHCEIDKLIEREQFYIDTLNPEFNIRKIAKNNLGIKYSEETKNKISIANIGWNPTPEQRANMSKSHIGKTISQEQKNKMRISNTKAQQAKSKFSFDDIINIRRIRKEGTKVKDIVKLYNSNIATIEAIIYRVTWKNVE